MRLLLALALSLLASTTHAQAWGQRPGGVFAKLSYGETTAGEQFDSEGATRPYAESVSGDAFQDHSAYLYAEAGVAPRVTLVGLLGYKALRTRDATFTYRGEGWSVLRAGVRYDLRGLAGLDGTRHALAVQALATLPLGYARNKAPALGGGQVDVQAMLHYGLSLYPAPLYAQAGVGYNHRSDAYGLSRPSDCALGTQGCAPDTQPDYGDEVLFSGELGFSDGSWLLLQALVQGAWSLKNPRGDLSATEGVATRQRFVKVGAGATVYPVRGVGLSVLYQTAIAGQSALRSRDVFFGIEFVRR